MKIKPSSPIIRAAIVAVIMLGIGWIGLDIPQSAVEESVDQQLDAWQVAESAEPLAADGMRAQVIDVIDGDTVGVLVNGEEERLRFIGIDTPETAFSPTGAECYWGEATARATALLEGQEILIQYDDTQARRDQHDRLLVYAQLPTGIDFGETMILEGFAREYTYDNAYQKQSAYQAAEASAQAAGRGVWGACAE